MAHSILPGNQNQRCESEWNQSQGFHFWTAYRSWLDVYVWIRQLILRQANTLKREKPAAIGTITSKPIMMGSKVLPKACGWRVDTSAA